MSLKERTSSAESTEPFVSRISLASGGRAALPTAPNTPEPAYHLAVWPDPSAAPPAAGHKPTDDRKHRRRSVEGANVRLKKKTVAFGRTVNVSQTIEVGRSGAALRFCSIVESSLSQNKPFAYSAFLLYRCCIDAADSIPNFF